MRHRRDAIYPNSRATTAVVSRRYSRQTTTLLFVLAILVVLGCGGGGEPVAPDVAAAPAVDPTLATLPEIQAMLETGQLTSEQLVQKSLDRIAAYDRQGPTLNAMITLNPRALETARALDEEQAQQGPRGPLHGIPVILKDNYDTVDMITTGGSALLATNQPSADAFVVARLREAGAVIIGKAHMSEFALSYGWLGYGSAIGQTKNPYKLARDPAGSSSGSAAAIAAGYGTLSTGTDTAGSIRSPATTCSLVGIKPTMGLLSRAGIIPCSLSLDVAGPLARSVSGAAFMLEAMAGPDPNDPATEASRGQSFTAQAALTKGALDGARLGVVRNYDGSHPGVDAVFGDSLAALEVAGATLVEIDFPDPLDNLWSVMGPAVDAEFGPQIESYLAGLAADQPKTLEDMIELAESDAIANSATPLNPARIGGFKAALATEGLEDPGRLKSLNELMPAIRQQVLDLMDGEQLDALVFPTMACPASVRHDAKDPTYTCDIDDEYRPGYMANTTGYPEITVPAGFSAIDDMPVGLSFFGRPFSETHLVGLAFDFEQATDARRTPSTTPRL